MSWGSFWVQVDGVGAFFGSKVLRLGGFFLGGGLQLNVLTAILAPSWKVWGHLSSKLEGLKAKLEGLGIILATSWGVLALSMGVLGQFWLQDRSSGGIWKILGISWLQVE
eukprot:6724156-Karenia_brevis.AAC.1